MKNKKNTILIVNLIFIILFLGCEDVLETTAYSELTTETILNSEDGINSVLNDSYAEFRDSYLYRIWGPDITTGFVWSRGGSIEVDFVDYENFTWSTTHAQINTHWQTLYQAIRNANIVLANLAGDNFSGEFVQLKTAEARFLRAYSYYELYSVFGPVPLLTTPEDLILPRASEEEIKTFITNELTAAAADLPWPSDAFGRATKGSALGVLTKFYLNTKQWSHAASTAQEIISSNQHELMDNYKDVFSFEHEGNSELLWAITYNSQGANQFLNALVFPNAGYPFPPGNSAFAAVTYVFDDKVDMFDESDSRSDLIVKQYTNTNTGQVVQLYGNDQSIPAKYPHDPNASGTFEGQDIPVVRYADILLSRAEALNETEGPTQEAIDLINQVRERAGASAVSTGDFTQESLRNFILQERTREFYFEGKSRSDQIRHGVFISNAQARGVNNAQPHHRLFPIPQAEMDANPEMIQNEGY
ncbi:RagB/SusD family nutrient uptake outer membrane protein [Rhodohalobacter sp. 614A]|uniref:RagB/SusD family nutrient uptake outer membrane protein n=1 Tax=Rhodohalobacter sp. 614A TaxID=2908649 RepID=UPI001F3061C3|nr:RagB/SusD family nutrient uptake outer membrane protein [Rhodohalobacter sp. 614A]